MPRYLERLQIVTRGAHDEVEISVDDRWAEPLENGIAQVLADNLGPELRSERITVFPWRGGVARVLDYQVVVMVLRFEGSPGHEVALQRASHWRGLPPARERDESNARKTGRGDREGDPITLRHARGGRPASASDGLALRFEACEQHHH